MPFAYRPVSYRQMKKLMLLSLLLACQLRADPTPTPTPATKMYAKSSDSTEWIPNCGFRISYTKTNPDYVVETKVGEAWKEAFRSPVWFYVQRFVCDKYPGTCSRIAVEPAPKSVVQHLQGKSVSRKREQASDREQLLYEQRRLEQRMSRPPGTPWRNFSAPDEHGYPNN